MTYGHLYTQNSGILYRKSAPTRPLGYYDRSSGYKKIKVGGKSCLVHRIIFYLVYGYLPTYIDHIDRDRLNNHPENLRACNKSMNVVNSVVRSDNKYGYKGVTYHKAAKKFVAQTFKDGKRLHIGVFDTPEDAAIAYNTVVAELFKEYAVLNKVGENN